MLLKYWTLSGNAFRICNEKSSKKLFFANWTITCVTMLRISAPNFCTESIQASKPPNSLINQSHANGMHSFSKNSDPSFVNSRQHHYATDIYLAKKPGRSADRTRLIEPFASSFKISWTKCFICLYTSWYQATILVKSPLSPFAIKCAKYLFD